MGSADFFRFDTLRHVNLLSISRRFWLFCFWSWNSGFCGPLQLPLQVLQASALYVTRICIVLITPYSSFGPCRFAFITTTTMHILTPLHSIRSSPRAALRKYHRRLASGSHPGLVCRFDPIHQTALYFSPCSVITVPVTCCICWNRRM